MYHIRLLFNFIGEETGTIEVDEILHSLSIRNNMLVGRDDQGRIHLYQLTY